MTEDGNGFYTLYGTGTQVDIQNALNAISITPASNMNTNASTTTPLLQFGIELTTYSTGGSQHTAVIPFTASVLPVTDPMTIAITGNSATPENTPEAFNVTLTNAADGTNTNIINGKAYIQLAENYTDLQGGNGATGTLYYNGNIINTTAVNGVAGITSGNYYVIDNVTNNQTLNFTYDPALYRDGTVTVNVLAQNQELNGWSGYDSGTLTSTKSMTFAVTPVNQGYTFDILASSTGTEDHLAQINITATDPDSSEILTSLILNNVPVGFLVYYGTDASNAALANNAGVNGTTSVQMTYGVDLTISANTWNIPLISGQMPAYVAIEAPQNWSGTLSGLAYTAIDSQNNVSDSAPFNVIVNPIADGVTINPTMTFNTEYNWTDINLNANMPDQDGSESMTVKLSAASGSTALDDTALFQLINGTSVDATFSNGTWTLSGVAYNEINNIQMLYHDYSGNINVQAQTVDKGAGMTDTSALTTTSTFTLTQTASTTINLSAETHDMTIVTTNASTSVIGGAGNDTIVVGNALDTVDGGGGSNTLQLASGINLDFSDANIAKIQKIDLSANGAHAVSNLTLDDVLNINSSHTLAIMGNNTDDVTITTTGWAASGTAVDNGTATTTTYTKGTDSVTLTVDDQINHHII
jgi:hypothetical protein